MINPKRELFTFSPFGLGCRECKINASIQMEERCIRDHLKKHGMTSSIVVVRSLLDIYKAQLEFAKAAGTIDPYRVDDNTYTGYSCICGQLFHSRKGSAVRHCKKIGCDASKLKKIELIKLCCGRYVSEAQVKSIFSPPHITEQFDYTAARAALLPFLPKHGEK